MATAEIIEITEYLLHQLALLIQEKTGAVTVTLELRIIYED